MKAARPGAHCLASTARTLALSATAGGTDASNVDALFNTLDGDGDGKVTQSEMAEGLKQLA